MVVTFCTQAKTVDTIEKIGGMVRSTTLKFIKDEPKNVKKMDSFTI